MSSSIKKMILFATRLHLAWHFYTKKIKSKSELLARELAKGKSEILEILIRFFENLWSMDVEAIEAYCEIITVECESMRLVCVCCCLDF